MFPKSIYYIIINKIEEVLMQTTTHRCFPIGNERNADVIL